MAGVSTTLRIASANVNGIRACVRRGFGAWLARREPDVVAVQEVRCPHDELPADAWPEHRLTYHPGLLAGRNGVGVLTRWAPSAVRMGFGSRAFDHEGRYLAVDLDAALERNDTRPGTGGDDRGAVLRRRAPAGRRRW